MGGARCDSEEQSEERNVREGMRMTLGARRISARVVFSLASKPGRRKSPGRSLESAESSLPKISQATWPLIFAGSLGTDWRGCEG